MKRGIVYCCDRREGELVEDGGEYVFRYAPKYLAQPVLASHFGHLAQEGMGVPCSASLSFFSRVAGQRRVKERQCRDLHIDEDDACSRLLATRTYGAVEGGACGGGTHGTHGRS